MAHGDATVGVPAISHVSIPLPQQEVSDRSPCRMAGHVTRSGRYRHARESPSSCSCLLGMLAMESLVPQRAWHPPSLGCHALPIFSQSSANLQLIFSQSSADL